MKRIGLFQNWSAIETVPNTYSFSMLDIADIYYNAYGMQLDLTIAAIHTNNLEVPSDLRTTSFNSLTMINRFKKLLDSIKVHLPTVTISSLVIGSEHDIYFGSNSSKWADYTVFYDSISDYAHRIWSGIKAASKLTFNGLTTHNTFAQTLNSHSDYIGVSYYPMDASMKVKPISTIPTDFATLVALYTSKPIYFYQYGYPSSSSCNSSELKQAQFIKQTFTTWDLYASNIKAIDFTWLHDLDTADVNFYGRYYGITDTSFLEFLHTLGLRKWDGNGTDKLAFTELQCQLKQRGYNSLSVNCVLGMEEKSNKKELKLFPNPVQDVMIIVNTVNFNKSNLNIYNPLGQKINLPITKETRKLTINTSSLNKGVYYIIYENKREVFIKN